MKLAQVVSYGDTDPNAPTPCFCADCLRLGGPARARLRDVWLRSLRRLTVRKHRGEGRRP